MAILNKSPLKILEKMERTWTYPGAAQFLVPTIIPERVKLRNSNFIGTFAGLIGTKAHEKFCE